MYIRNFYVGVAVKTTEMWFGPDKGELAAAEIPALIICDSPVVQHWLQTWSQDILPSQYCSDIPAIPGISQSKTGHIIEFGIK